MDGACVGSGIGRSRVRLLLASSSVVALLGGGAPSAFAACNPSYSNQTTTGCTNSGSISGIAINNSTLTSAITNTGTISANGIVLSGGSTITGGIIDTGKLFGGITVADGVSKITSPGPGILAGYNVGSFSSVTVATFGGGISNAGTITASGHGIQVGGTAYGVAGSVTVSSFSGGISNSGTIAASGDGIFIGGKALRTPFTVSSRTVTVSAFSGGISNTGKISAAGNGILVGGTIVGLSSLSVSSFGGNISNAGTISAGVNGIFIGGHASSSTNFISTFAGSIVNSGTIAAVNNGIRVGVSGSGSNIGLSTFTGGITNSGLISASGSGFHDVGLGIDAASIGASIVNSAGGTISGYGGAISIGGTAFSGSISNAGTLQSQHGDVIHVSVATFAGSISNSGTISRGLVGILVDADTFGSGITNSGTITVTGQAISVQGGTFLGGIVNNAGGRITGNGGSAGVIALTQLSYFQGGITNAGMIFSRFNAINSEATTFVGNISNSGTITVRSGYVINVGGATFTGKIVNGAGGLLSNPTSASVIHVSASSFLGAISNTGIISGGGAGVGIAVGSVQFGSNSAGGGIVNMGSITAGGGGIRVGSSGTLAISSFAGGVTNSGTISALGTNFNGAAGNGIIVGGTAITGGILKLSSFAGGIVNSSGGLIAALGNGIQVGGVAGKLFGGPSGGSIQIVNFGGGISNAGTILAGGKAGIFVGGTATAASSVTISAFSGGISNSGTISTGTNGVGIYVLGVNTFNNGITNSGLVTVGANGAGIVLGATQFNGNVSNSGTITGGHTGIFVCSCVTFVGGGISNTGLISANTGIYVENFAPVSIFNSGTVVGTGGTAVDLTHARGGNTFTLGAGYAITGSVIGAGSDTFQLGGSGNGTFNLSTIGSGQQYQGFTTFNEIGSAAWTVTGTFSQANPWTVQSGTLVITGSLGNAAGVTLSGGAIVIGSNNALGAGTLTMAPGTTLSFLDNGNFTVPNKITISGDPNFSPPAGTTQTISGVIANGATPGTLNMNGAGTLVLTATETYTGPTDVTVRHARRHRLDCKFERDQCGERRQADRHRRPRRADGRLRRQLRPRRCRDARHLDQTVQPRLSVGRALCRLPQSDDGHVRRRQRQGFACRHGAGQLRLRQLHDQQTIHYPDRSGRDRRHVCGHRQRQSAGRLCRYVEL